MATPKLSLLTFPQKYKDGKLFVNLLILPRNINPLTALAPGFPAFADAGPAFKAMAINSLDGLPAAVPTHTPTSLLINPISSSRAVWEALKAQIELTDGLKIDDAAGADPNNQASASLDRYKNVSIRKYLPETYRQAFNFTRPRTRYASTGDEYHCSVKNNGTPTDVPSNRSNISWGKAIALCLRNPLLAEKAGLIYKLEITVSGGLFDEGGWLYLDMGSGSGFETLDKGMLKLYAARIPALKGLSGRQLFAPVQFPVGGINNGGYDEIMREAIMYDDGFAKIVHANQPVNDYLLEEKDKSNPPQKDTGIRLGWDDEQLTIWQNRQMLQKEEHSGESVDAPLGVFSYCIDAKKEGDTAWHSQNRVTAPAGIIVQGGLVAVEAGTVLEIGSEVHPSAHGRSATEGFWLPMYFTNWLGKSLAIPDKDAEEIHQTKADTVKETKSRYTDPNYYKSLPKTPPYTDAEIAAFIADYKKKNTLQTVPKRTFHPYVQHPDDALTLEYGNSYNFRIRLMDLTGGTPSKTDDPIHGAPRPVEKWHFKRHTVAGPPEILNINETLNKPLRSGADIPDTSVLENITSAENPVLKIRRPKLAYPAVVFTGKYKNPDAIARLKALAQDPEVMKEAVTIGLPDPDVNKFRVLVEIKSLEMDNALSRKGNESFVKLYEKEFDFETDPAAGFSLHISYAPYATLPFDGSFSDTGAADTLRLPANRKLRLTFTSLVSHADNVYADESIREGGSTLLSSFRLLDEETPLLTAVDGGLKAMFLQPEHDGHVKAAVGLSNLNPIFVYPEKQTVKSSTPVELERIADVLNISAHQLTLQGPKGMRMQFGCSKLIRHSLAPDSSSLTLSSLNEVFNHWLVAVNYTLQRDWSWDGLELNSFRIYRTVKLEGGPDGVEELAGVIKVSDTVNINALYEAERDYSNLIFLDAIDPKVYNHAFPKELMVSYRIEANTKVNVPLGVPDPAVWNLPVTSNPIQIPRLVSAGVALSPYQSGEKYESTSVRQRFLWLEVQEPPLDPNDTYYVRVLTNAPDPLLCKMDESILFNVPEEPPLAINPEKIRVIIPGMQNDHAGLSAMQEMIPDDSEKPRFFMLPLPPGLHSESDELFGFFTYEIRVGHKKELWSTAQARFGRPLKVNGVQHPAPSLVCNAFRRKFINPANLLVNEIAVSAPYATAVLNGRNVTSMPPQTSLWAFLYAQVKQADGSAYRNILLGSKELNLSLSRNRAEEGTVYGTNSFNQQEVSSWLRGIGLPVSSPLSILCVEMFPLHNRWNVVSGRDQYKPNPGVVGVLTDKEYSVASELVANFFSFSKPQAEAAGTAWGNASESHFEAAAEKANPLIEGLGRFRIYRTSALVPVENICCDDC